MGFAASLAFDRKPARSIQRRVIYRTNMSVKKFVSLQLSNEILYRVKLVVRRRVAGRVGSEVRFDLQNMIRNRNLP